MSVNSRVAHRARLALLIGLTVTGCNAVFDIQKPEHRLAAHDDPSVPCIADCGGRLGEDGGGSAGRVSSDPGGANEAEAGAREAGASGVGAHDGGAGVNRTSAGEAGSGGGGGAGASEAGGGANGGGANGGGAGLGPSPSAGASNDGSALGALNGACEHEGNYACAAHNAKGQLVCSSARWVANGSCQGNLNCDSEPGSSAGSCQPILTQCQSLQAGDSFCATDKAVARCGADRVTSTGTMPCAAPTPSCVAGKCAACLPNALKCSDASHFEACSEEGSWNPPVSCTNGFCNGAGACGECAAGTVRCSGTGTQLCSAQGTWGTASPCSKGFCNGAGVCGECTAKSAQCAGNATQTCSATGTWSTPLACVNQACSSGTCTGVCTPNTFECLGNTGVVCGATGQWISNGSAFLCACAAPIGRFTRVSAALVLDTSTGQTWDVNMRPAASWADASNTCASAGMRLPSSAEWSKVMLVHDCTFAPSPFDEAAMPESSTTSGALGDGTILWTNKAEARVFRTFT